MLYIGKFVAGKWTPTVSTKIHNVRHSVITSAPIGSSVHDQATVTGIGGPANPVTPTGTVDFTVWDNKTCGGAGTAAGTVALVNGVAHPSNDATVTNTGLSFQAHYNGDDNYFSADGPCEPLTATKLTPTVTTEIHDAAHNVITSAPVGSSVHDKVTVTGGVGAGTGNVTFYLYSDTACSTNPATETKALGGGTVESSDTTVPSTGLSYKVSYAGDANYNAAQSACEPLTATGLTPTVSTQIHNASHTVITSAPVGASVHDQATVTGSGGTPTGTVNFTVYANTTCSGAGTAAGTVALVNGVAHPSNNATMTRSGLSFKAHYNGDANYNAADSACEPLPAKGTTLTRLTGSKSPSRPGQAVTFTAIVSVYAPGPGSPTGSVRFKDGQTVLAVVPLDALWRATLTISTLLPGTHIITAEYLGDVNYNGSVSLARRHVVLAQ
jgi:hypothetical protein